MPYKTPWLKDKNAGIVKIRNAVGDTTTQTGNPVSVDNEFGLGEVDSLSVALNPQQNLNGYDSPWIGGAGVNKISVNRALGTTSGYAPADAKTLEFDKYYVGYSWNGYYQPSTIASYSINGETVTLNTNRNAYGIAFPVPVKAGEQYYVNATLGGSARIGISYCDSDGKNINSSGNIVGKTITIPNGCTIAVVVVYDANASGNDVSATNMMFNNPSSVTEWTPYENICPIYPANSRNILNYNNLTQAAIDVGITVNEDGTIYDSSPSSDSRSWNYASCNWQMTLPAGTYTFTIECTTPNPDSVAQCRAYKSDGTSLFTNIGSDIFKTGGTATRTFTFTEPTTIGIIVKQYSVVYRVQIERGSSATPYQPYQGITVERTGKNLLKVTSTSQTNNGVTFTVNDDGTITVNGIPSVNTYFYLVGTTGTAQWQTGGKDLIINGCQSGGSTTSYRLICRIDGNTWVNDVGDGGSIPSTATYINNLGIAIQSGTVCNNLVFKPMIRLASDTDDTFEPYQSNTYTSDLEQFVYGGTVDLVTGVLTVDRASITLTASNRSGFTAYSPNGRGYWVISDIKKDPSVSAINALLKSSNCPVNTTPISSISSATAMALSGYTNAQGVYIVVPNLATETDFDDYMNANPTQLVYPLAEPQTIQLTPQQISLLTGINYISSSDDTTLTVTLPGWTSLIDPSKIKHDIYDLDAGNTTGRNLAGEMLRDRVAVKEKLNMEFPPMVADDYYAMLNLIKDQFFDVQYYSPFTGGKRVATMYVGDREGEPYYDYDVNDHENNMWTNVKFNFIER